jgi:trans-aconitate 2-methyltransferase
MFDWKPQLYLTFEKERTQPAIDLVMRIEQENPKRIIDVGCGPGNSTFVVKNRWANAEIIGLDNSENMLAQARTKYDNIKWICADASDGLNDFGTFDIVFSNAAIQWMPNQPQLLSNFYDVLNIGGVMAVQVPCVNNMPIHMELQNLLSKPKWRQYFDTPVSAHFIHTADFYYDVLSTFSNHFDLWQTDYYHVMNSHSDLVNWYRGSGLRPYLDCLTDEGIRQAFLDDFENALLSVYPFQKDNRILFPFTRIFFIVNKTA